MQVEQIIIDTHKKNEQIQLGFDINIIELEGIIFISVQNIYLPNYTISIR